MISDYDPFISLILYLGARLDVKTSLFRVSSDCDPVQDPTFGPGCAILHSWEKSAQRRCKSSVGYHLHELSLQSEAGKWCKMKPVQSELSIICTFALLYFAILYMKCSFVTCSWNYIHMLSAPSKYFQNLHCPMQGHLCVSLFQGFLHGASCTLYNVKHFAVLRSMQCSSTLYYSLYTQLCTLYYALCAMHYTSSEYFTVCLYGTTHAQVLYTMDCTVYTSYALFTLRYAPTMLNSLCAMHYAMCTIHYLLCPLHTMQVQCSSRTGHEMPTFPQIPDQESRPPRDRRRLKMRIIQIIARNCSDDESWMQIFLQTWGCNRAMAMMQIFYTFARFSAGREPGTY